MEDLRPARPATHEVSADENREEGEVDDEELAAHARGRLSAYKCPKRFFTVEQLPRNEMGKVLKDELIETASEGNRTAP